MLLLLVARCVPVTQGCSGNQQQDTKLLLEMAQLLQGMEQQRISSGRSSNDGGHSQGVQAPALPSDVRLLQLLEHACSNLSKLTSTTMQLFASDMSDVLQQYR
jgi:hypothetical protein